MLADSVTECPFCGDKDEGYRYIESVKYMMHRSWGNDPRDDNPDHELKAQPQGSFRCNVCNKIIKRVDV